MRASTGTPWQGAVAQGLHVLGRVPIPRPSAPTYDADDRSLLLPCYKRWVVGPTVRRLPAALSPNAITHAGHVCNLAALALLLALRPERGGWLLVAAALTQLYVWCDNVDGAHARRTGQASAYGELLDHGLDILNVIYVGLLSAYALGMTPLGWVMMTVLTAGATAVTYWEQTETGVFRLGMLNQIESSLVLTAVFVGSALLGRSWWAEQQLFGVALRDAFLWWVAGTIAVGVARNVARVRGTQPHTSWAPVALLLALDLVVMAAALLGGVSPRVALAVSMAAGVFFALRMLGQRLAPATDRHRPVEGSLLIVAAGVAAVTVVNLGHAEVPAVARPHLDTVVAALACMLFGAASIGDARRSAASLRGL